MTLYARRLPSPQISLEGDHKAQARPVSPHTIKSVFSIDDAHAGGGDDQSAEHILECHEQQRRGQLITTEIRQVSDGLTSLPTHYYRTTSAIHVNATLPGSSTALPDEVILKGLKVIARTPSLAIGLRQAAGVTHQVLQTFIVTISMYLNLYRAERTVHLSGPEAETRGNSRSCQGNRCLCLLRPFRTRCDT
jgi:hypothetical protein